MRITSVTIRNFKRIKDVKIDLDDVTLLVGGNNSGKSSALQAVHFAVSCLRSARAAGKRDSQPATTLGANQFKYVPTNEIMKVRHGSEMTQYNGPQFIFSYVGHNENIYETKLNLYRVKTLTYS